jgi:hypothetical protein
MRKSLLKWIYLILIFTITISQGQSREKPLSIFGYFQNSFFHETGYTHWIESQSAYNSFNLQQLNLFLQKDISTGWRAFVDFQILNTFSSARRWGSFNIEEAWIRYRLNEKFTLKLGLQIPIFNHLNEIKNRTPLLPYVVRPLVYETSFSEFIAVDEYTPTSAFVQAYGFIPIKNIKLDYAAYVGNSPNISWQDPNRQFESQQTGVDTTDTILLGGRVGIRLGEFKVGLSSTIDYVNFFEGARDFIDAPPSQFSEIPRIRFGGDLSYHIWKISLWAEFIKVTYDDDFPDVSINRFFYYATLGYRIGDDVLLYLNYMKTEEDITEVTIPDNGEPTLYTGRQNVHVPSCGLSYTIFDRLAFKAQFAPVKLKGDLETLDLEFDINFNYYAVAISVFF